MDEKPSSIKYGALPVRRRHPGKRPRRITEALIGFDAEENRIVVTWGWWDIQVVDVPSGARINARPTLLLFSISYN